MRPIASVFLVALFLIPTSTALNVDRIELEGNISLIITSPKENYYILTLVNKNDFNVSLVENIQINLTYDIDPSSVRTVDNYNNTVVPDAINQRSIVFTYNGTLQALGYGKIFLDVERAPPTPSPTPRPGPKKTEAPTSPPPPPTVTSPPETSPAPPMEPAPVEKVDSTAIPESPPPQVPPEPVESALPPVTAAIIVLFLLAILAGLFTLIS